MRATSFKEFSDAALGRTSKQPETNPLIPEQPNSAQTIPYVFDFQSYFDTSLQETAIEDQPLNQLIVPSTERKIQTSGYGLALAPWSEAPVAVQFLIGAQPSSSTVFILKPGEVLRPFGKPNNNASSFSGFRYGLPFGWLGGGLTHLFVLATADSKVEWPENRKELLFHRQRLVIRATDSSTVTYRNNWPLAFPWINAQRGVTGGTVPQGSQPSFQMLPTRVVGRLNVTSLAGPATVYAIFASNEAFDASPVAVNLTFQPFTAITITDLDGAAYTTPRPVFEFPVSALKLGGPNASLALFADPDSDLVGQSIDVVRYGCL